MFDRLESDYELRVSMLLNATFKLSHMNHVKYSPVVHFLRYFNFQTVKKRKRKQGGGGIVVFYSYLHHHYSMQGFVFISFIRISLFNARFRFHHHFIFLGKFYCKY